MSRAAKKTTKPKGVPTRGNVAQKKKRTGQGLKTWGNMAKTRFLSPEREKGGTDTPKKRKGRGGRCGAADASPGRPSWRRRKAKGGVRRHHLPGKKKKGEPRAKKPKSSSGFAPGGESRRGAKSRPKTKNKPSATATKKKKKDRKTGGEVQAGRERGRSPQDRGKQTQKKNESKRRPGWEKGTRLAKKETGVQKNPQKHRLRLHP